MGKKNIFNAPALHRKIGGLAAFQFLFFCPQVLFADNDVPYVEVPTNVSITGMLGRIRGYFFGAIIAACVFMVLWGAFDLVTSAGDEKKAYQRQKSYSLRFHRLGRGRVLNGDRELDNERCRCRRGRIMI